MQQALGRFLDDTVLDRQRRKVCRHLLACHTPAMGGMRLRCEACHGEHHVHHGCRDRHCPQCQGRASRQWAERQRDQLLPVPYHHVVFTLPHALNGWIALHPALLYRLLFDATWGTLRAFGRDPRRLGGELGMTAVLHTWGQNLSRHVHLHCLVPGGALDAAGHWRATRGRYLFPVRALSRHFRGRMVALLRRAADAGELHRVTRPGEIDGVLDALMSRDWVVYTKDCVQHTARVVEYLARYTHRIAITDARILAVDEAQVTFRYTDYRDGNQRKTLCLAGEEFVRRYLQHILPRGLMRIRHFGFLANRCRREKLAVIRRAIGEAQTARGAAIATDAQCDRASALEGKWLCPSCRRGVLQLVAQVLPCRPVRLAPG